MCADSCREICVVRKLSLRWVGFSNPRANCSKLNCFCGSRGGLFCWLCIGRYNRAPLWSGRWGGFLISLPFPSGVFGVSFVNSTKKVGFLFWGCFGAVGFGWTDPTKEDGWIGVGMIPNCGGAFHQRQGPVAVWNGGMVRCVVFDGRILIHSVIATVT